MVFSILRKSKPVVGVSAPPIKSIMVGESSSVLWSRNVDGVVMMDLSRRNTTEAASLESFFSEVFRFLGVLPRSSIVESVPSLAWAVDVSSLLSLVGEGLQSSAISAE